MGLNKNNNYYFDSFLSGASSGSVFIIFGVLFIWIISVSRIRKI